MTYPQATRPGCGCSAWPAGVLTDEDRGRRRRDRLAARLAETLPAGAFVTGPGQPESVVAAQAALAQLPAGDAELLRLVAWEELTPAEAGHVLGLSPNLARVRLHRARARLRSLLDAPTHQLATAAPRPEEDA